MKISFPWPVEDTVCACFELAFFYTAETLYSLSGLGILSCIFCQERVSYAASTAKRAYFILNTLATVILYVVYSSRRGYCSTYTEILEKIVYNPLYLY
jgi:hypothetical protein